MKNGSIGAPVAFLNWTTEAAQLIAAYDWSRTALGPMEYWPNALKNVVSLMICAPMPMAALWGADGYMLYNDAYARLAGRLHPDLLGRKAREGWPEIAGLNDQAIRAGLAGGTLTVRDRELWVHRELGLERVWINLDYSPIIDESGAPAGVMMVVVETTDRVLAERRVIEERDRMQRMFAQAPGFVAMLDGPEHVFVLTNQAYRQLIGDRDLIGRRVIDAVPEAETQGFIRLLDIAYQTGKPFVGEGLKLSLPDGEGRLEDHYIDFVYQPVRDADGAPRGIFVAGSDVTERVLAEVAFREGEARYRQLNDALIFANATLEEQVARRTAELGRKEARLRAIFESSFMFQGALSADGAMLDTNATSLEAIGESLDAVRGVPFHETPWFAHTPGARDHVRQLVGQAAAGERVRQELQLNLPVGGTRWFDLTMRPSSDAEGRVSEILIEAFETTELHRGGATA